MPDARVSLVFGGDEREFRFGIGEVLALEESCNIGIAEITWRLAFGRWHAKEARETLRLGLLGAGMEASRARQLVDDCAGAGNLYEAALLARKILGVVMESSASEGDPPGKEQDDAAAPEAIASPRPSSTATAPS